MRETYIYIYIQREREREGGSEGERETGPVLISQRESTRKVHWRAFTRWVGELLAQRERIGVRDGPGAAAAGGRPGRRQRGEWAYDCRARVVGIGVRAAAARAECDMRAAWARVGEDGDL